MSLCCGNYFECGLGMPCVHRQGSLNHFYGNALANMQMGIRNDLYNERQKTALQRAHEIAAEVRQRKGMVIRRIA